MINIIVSVKGLQKISDRLYIMVCAFNIIHYYSDRCQINEEIHVNYRSLLNLVQSVMIINTKYVD